MLAILSIGLSAEGAVLFGNLDRTRGGSIPATTVLWQAQQFTTDGVAYQLDHIVLFMKRVSESGNASVSIWSDVSSLPGTPLYPLVLNDLEGYTESLSETQFTPSLAVHLDANSTYWVVLQSADAGSEFEWSFTLDETGSGAGFSPRWSELNPAPGGSWYAMELDPYQMQVTVTALSAVPEPASAAFLCGLIGSGLLLRRRI